VARQGAAWDPLLKWADEEFGARLIPVQGVIHVPQPAVSLARLSAPLHGMSAFELTGFHDLVSLSGSLVIGLAAIRRHLPIDTLWTLSRIDETWQREQWGADDEADRAAENKRLAFLEAWEFYRLTQFSN
jgi:chaperone required for assembly of F1-ATPase